MYVLWVNKNKQMHFFHIVPIIHNSLQPVLEPLEDRKRLPVLNNSLLSSFQKHTYSNI